MQDTLLKEIQELQKQLDYHFIQVMQNLKYTKNCFYTNYNDIRVDTTSDTREHYSKIVLNHINKYFEIHQQYTELLQEINDDFTEDYNSSKLKTLKIFNMNYKLSGEFC